jgi:hypothetical protein
MSRLKDKMIEIEQRFWELLNDEGKTNDQALKILDNEYGSFGVDEGKRIIKEQENEDFYVAG